MLKTTMTPKPFHGLSNFRDMGGLPMAGGRRLRAGCWFRSDCLAALTDLDLETLRRLNLSTVCDLRTPEEREAAPDRLPPDGGIRTVSIPMYYQIPGFLRTDYIACLGDAAREKTFIGEMRRFYVKMALEDREEVGRILDLAMDENSRPLLIHCTGGKDRTGFASAVIQWLAGVERPAIMGDYLESNRVVSARMQTLIEREGLTPEQWKPMTDVYPEYLELALEAIVERFGDVERYYLQGCGGDPARLEAFRACAPTR